MRGQSVLRADSRAWPSAPAYAVPAIVTQRRLSVPMAWRAAVRIGAGSRYPGGNCRWVATTTPISSTAVRTENALDMMNPSQRGMALIYKVGGTDLWGAILSCEGARDLV